MANPTTKRCKRSRRDLLVSAAGLGAFAAVGLNPHEASGHEASGHEVSGHGLSGKIRKSLKYSMIRERLPLVEQLQLLSRIGFDGVEIRAQDRLDPKELRDAIDTSGVRVHSIIQGVNNDYGAAIELCKNVGGDALLIIAEEKKELDYDENFKRSIDLIRRTIPLAEAQNIRLLVENVRASFLKTAEEMARFIDELKSPIVGAYFDTGNAITWTQQSAHHWIRVLGKRIVKLDIKDRGHPEFGDAKRRSKTAVGTDGGEVHWQKVREELTGLDFSGWASAEVQGGDAKRLAGISAWMDQVLDL